jgi:FKBP-type peptidyl-prolyl cis-trans isomerase SlpA
MSMSEPVVGTGTRVTLHFSLSLSDGTMVDSNFDSKPATFEVGDGSLLPDFEAALFGMAVGDEDSFEIPPEKAFGQHNESNVQVMKRTDFSDELDLQAGLVVSFADANGAELPGVISQIEDDEVVVDFNHPLSGHTLVFRAAIVHVEPVVTH